MQVYVPSGAFSYLAVNKKESNLSLSIFQPQLNKANSRADTASPTKWRRGAIISVSGEDKEKVKSEVVRELLQYLS